MDIKVKNHLGEVLKLDTLNFPVVNVDGLTPSGATINTGSTATVDGTFFNSSYVNERNIVLTIVPDDSVDVERARLTLYKYFKPKYPITLYFKTKYRDVYINGYTETFEGNPYSDKQSFQASIICPQPFFNAVNPLAVSSSKVVGGFTFPVSIPEEGLEISTLTQTTSAIIYNDGEESTGMIIEILARGNVVEPTIYNSTTKEMFRLNVEMVEGDVITIDTRKGNKHVKMLHVNTETNLMNRIASGSSWLQIATGETEMQFGAVYGSENMDIKYTLNVLYEGV